MAAALTMVGCLLLMLSAMASASCPDKSAASNLDIERFSGLWNIVKESDVMPETSINMKCKQSIFRVLKPNTGYNIQVKIMNYNLTSRAFNETRLSMQKMNTSHLDGKFEMLISKENGLSARYYVLGTDYDNFAVVWICFMGFAESKNLEYYAVLSRKKSLGEPYMIEADKMLPPGSYRTVDQTSCPPYRTPYP